MEELNTTTQFHADALSLGSARSGTKFATKSSRSLSASVLQRSAYELVDCVQLNLQIVVDAVICEYICHVNRYCINMFET